MPPLTPPPTKQHAHLAHLTVYPVTVVHVLHARRVFISNLEDVSQPAAEPYFLVRIVSALPANVQLAVRCPTTAPVVSLGRYSINTPAYRLVLMVTMITVEYVLLA